MWFDTLLLKNTNHWTDAYYFVFSFAQNEEKTNKLKEECPHFSSFSAAVAKENELPTHWSTSEIATQARSMNESKPNRKGRQWRQEPKLNGRKMQNAPNEMLCVIELWYLCWLNKSEYTPPILIRSPFNYANISHIVYECAACQLACIECAIVTCHMTMYAFHWYIFGRLSLLFVQQISFVHISGVHTYINRIECFGMHFLCLKQVPGPHRIDTVSQPASQCMWIIGSRYTFLPHSHPKCSRIIVKKILEKY